MSRTEQELEGVTLLGNQGTQYEFDYRPDVLETFENKHPGDARLPRVYLVVPQDWSA